jgi:hypothetical protein
MGTLYPYFDSDGRLVVERIGDAVVIHPESHWAIRAGLVKR